MFCFFWKFGVLPFLVTSVLIFAILSYYQRCYLCSGLISLLCLKYFQKYTMKHVETGLKKSLFCSSHAPLTPVSEELYTVGYAKLYRTWTIWNYSFYKVAAIAIQNIFFLRQLFCRRFFRWLSSGNTLIMIIFSLGTPPDETVTSTTRSVVSQPFSKFTLRTKTIDIKRQNRFGKKEFWWCWQHIVTQRRRK